MKLAYTLGLLVSMFASCNQPRQSELDFIVNPQELYGLAAKVKNPSIELCIRGVAQSTEWEEKIRKATLAWIEPMRTMSSDPLTSVINITFLNGSCSDTATRKFDGEINISVNYTAATYQGDRPRMVLSTEGYYASYRVILHEFGHMFGLQDTYIRPQGGSGRSGNCMPGQPQSLMCNTSLFEAPQEDDIAGLAVIFAELFPNETQPSDPNLSVPPPATTQPQQQQPTKPVATEYVNVALSEPTNDHRVEISFTVNEYFAQGSPLSLKYCMKNALENCTQISSWKSAATSSRFKPSGLQAFESQPEHLAAGDLLMVEYTNGHYRSVENFLLEK